jgi:hypothetical protein
MNNNTYLKKSIDWFNREEQKNNTETKCYNNWYQKQPLKNNQINYFVSFIIEKTHTIGKYRSTIRCTTWEYNWFPNILKCRLKKYCCIYMRYVNFICVELEWFVPLTKNQSRNMKKFLIVNLPWLFFNIFEYKCLESCTDTQVT